MAFEIRKLLDEQKAIAASTVRHFYSIFEEQPRGKRPSRQSNVGIMVIIKKTTKFKFAQRIGYTRKWLWVKNNRILLLTIKIIKLCLQKLNYRYVILTHRL